MKKAFTMLELVFVIVIIGILSFMAASSFQRNTLREAADQLVSHIRYTQHLAMMDDKFDPNDSTWYKSRWQLIFGKSSTGTKHTNDQYAYTIFSDTFGSKTGQPDFTSISITEIAHDPLDSNKVLSGGYSGTIHYANEHANIKLNLGESYGVTLVTMSGGCSYARIAFDYLGRPIRGDSSTMTGAYTAPTQRLILNDCNIILSNSDNNITITVKPETGYAYISAQN